MSRLYRIILLSFIFFFCSCFMAESALAIRLFSPAFENNGMIPEKYTCDGEGISPELQWDDVPQGAGINAFILMVDDPEAPNGVFTHWLIYNLSIGITRLAEGVNLPSTMGSVGLNSLHQRGYAPLCPPYGETHHYHFRFFVMDNFLNYDSRVNRDYLLETMKGHVVDSTEWVGIYKRKPKPFNR